MTVDTSASTGAGIVNQSTSIFDYPDTPTTSLIELQTTPTQPLPATMTAATGLLTPDVNIQSRLAHFPPDLYDLSDNSHLTRFLKALLGDSGVGQIRKRQLIARLQSALNSTHFYDLDSFYGSLFGAKRGITGALPINPYTDVATPDGWDEVSTIDAQFRERLLKLAKAITMGGTPLGLEAMAEALTEVDCEVYEVWSLIDDQYGLTTGTPHSWDDLEATYSSWNATQGLTWNDLEGTITFGNMGINARNEIVIRPKKVYDPTPEGQRLRADDVSGIMRVLEVLKPANALLSVNADGVEVHRPVTIGSIVADSEYWEISARVIPKDELQNWYKTVYTAYDHRANPQGVNSAKPVPAFTNSQGTQHSYVGEVTSTSASGVRFVGPSIRDLDQTRLITKVDYDNVRFPDGSHKRYLPANALIDLQSANAGRAANASVMVAAPYSGERKAVPTHG